MNRKTLISCCGNFYIPAVLLFLSFCLLSMSCKQQRPEKSCDTYAELPDPYVDSLSDWSKADAGLHVTFGSIDTRYSKSVMPDIQKVNTCDLTGWKGERLSAQILLWSAEDVKQIECEFSEFKSESGVLPSSIAQARFVRYVMTDIFGPGCGYRKEGELPSSLVADMLDNIECMDIEGRTVRPVWVSLHIPADAAKGTYTGTVKVYGRNQDTRELKITLNVQDKILPAPSEWPYHLDLWQHPSAVARAQGLELWSDAHFEALKPLMKMLADAGQKVITTTLNKDPWNNQCYDAYADMIVWSKKADGSWEYDYTVFDKWVQLMMDLGINKMINCYSMLPWNNELHYKDLSTGEFVTVKADPGTPVFYEIWKPFLADFVKHLKEKGWLEITNIAMDERSPKDMEYTVGLLQKDVPELGISLADNHKSYKKYPFIRDMCVKIDAEVDPADIEARRSKGLNTTYYVCCADKFPNAFTYSQPAEATYIAWYGAALDFDGFLRWAYNSWVENPVTDSRFRRFPAGDTYIVYPEARSSIRFERMVEGIQDVEKIRILRKMLEETNTQESLSKLNELNESVLQFGTDKPDASWVEKLNTAKALINKLSE